METSNFRKQNWKKKTTNHDSVFAVKLCVGVCVFSVLAASCWFISPVPTYSLDRTHSQRAFSQTTADGNVDTEVALVG